MTILVARPWANILNSLYLLFIRKDTKTVISENGTFGEFGINMTQITLQIYCHKK